MEQHVTLEQMLAARDARQERIAAALGGTPLISFSLNIPGPVKYSPSILRAYREGQRWLTEAFGGKLTLLSSCEDVTGCEALYAVGDDALNAKKRCAAMEDGDALGRLFDMDVIDSDGRKIERTELGLDERGCMVCGAPGRGCAARRLHSVEQLQQETARRLTAFFFAQDRDFLSALAAASLLEEVHTTPKPGLVDRANNGSHSDMDLALFEKSAAALTHYWGECFTIGAETACLNGAETFRRLRAEGLAAEGRMLEATGGVNTHKGAIFIMGILCGAAGRLWKLEEPSQRAESLCEECAKMTEQILREELEQLSGETALTAGERLYLKHGLQGARGEVMRGLPGVREIALPALRCALAQGCVREHAAAITLLHLIARGTDTNLFKRGGADGAAWAAASAAALLQQSPFPSSDQIAELDRQFVERNLSPGGCADLLAATLFLHDWEMQRG